MGHGDTSVWVGNKQQPPHYSYCTEAYDRVQLIYVEEGCLFFRGHKADEIALRPHMLALLCPGDRFALACGDVGYRGFFVITQGGDTASLAGKSITGLADRSVRLMAELLRRHMAAPVPESREVLAGLGWALIWEVLALARQRAPRAAPEWADAVRTMLELNLGTGISVAEALATLGMSSRQLGRHFREHFGTSPKAYQSLLRADEARRMLVETQMDVTSIAMELGYSSSQHFASQFRRLTGCTPTAYRRNPGGAEHPGRT